MRYYHVNFDSPIEYVSTDTGSFFKSMCVCVWPVGEWRVAQRKQEEYSSCEWPLGPHRVIISHSWAQLCDWDHTQRVNHKPLCLTCANKHTACTNTISVLTVYLHCVFVNVHNVGVCTCRYLEEYLDSKRPLSPLSPLSDSPESTKPPLKTKTSEQHHVHKSRDKNRDSAIKVIHWSTCLSFRHRSSQPYWFISPVFLHLCTTQPKMEVECVKVSRQPQPQPSESWGPAGHRGTVPNNETWASHHSPLCFMFVRLTRHLCVVTYWWHKTQRLHCIYLIFCPS